ncbi:hypothetical protein GUJ93_ZPchr0006g41774 [Zizania palustris]|uniref:Uncharacterized protein n=1 Tax=Zizania palustris TaxID=103762 RepID=A0A8J5TDF0_ZIZPA|nr:hypothetical protein GUJ93_ZPchr0006g41774 [Zizania palustris]
MNTGVKICEDIPHASHLILLGGPQWQNAKNLALLSCRQGQFPSDCLLETFLPNCRLEVCRLDVLPPICRLDLVPPGCFLDTVPLGGLRRSSVEAVAGSRRRHYFGL